MAGVSDIVVRAELRPCYVRKRKCLFHMWVQRDGEEYGLVEDETGMVMLVIFRKIKFADDAVSEYCFRDIPGFEGTLDQLEALHV